MKKKVGLKSKVLRDHSLAKIETKENKKSLAKGRTKKKMREGLKSKEEKRLSKLKLPSLVCKLKQIFNRHEV